MVRFEKIGNTYVNVDKIRSFWRDSTKDEILVVKLDDGEVLRTHDERGGWQSAISGYEHIVQVIPCIKPLYVRYRGEDGNECESPVYYMGLCASGDIRPLEICGTEMVYFSDDMSNFIGLYSETLEEERRTDFE